MEFLFLGGRKQASSWLEESAGGLQHKLSSIDPATPWSVPMFFWKLHNAISSVVEYGEQCRTDETQWPDQATTSGSSSRQQLYGCNPNSCPLFVLDQTKLPLAECLN